MCACVRVCESVHVLFLFFVCSCCFLFVFAFCPSTLAKKYIYKVPSGTVDREKGEKRASKLHGMISVS